MDISLIVMFVVGLLFTPVLVGLFILHEGKNRRRFARAKRHLDKMGYEAINKSDPRIQPWGTKADARVPAESPWFYKSDSGYTR